MMKPAVLFFAALLTGCSTAIPNAGKIADIRASLPYHTTTGHSRSMEPVFWAESTYVVVSKPYDRLARGDPAVFLPAGCSIPVCHFIGHPIGTDSWSTYGFNQPDDTYRWILTRDNYIGVMQ